MPDCNNQRLRIDKNSKRCIHPEYQNGAVPLVRLALGSFTLKWTWIETTSPGVQKIKRDKVEQCFAYIMAMCCGFKLVL